MSDRYELPSELNIYSAIASRDALMAWLAERGDKAHEPIDISARNVAEVDGAGLQLLAALTNAEYRWRLVDASPAIAQACQSLGFSQWLSESLQERNLVETTT